jgi:glycosyltransferase involved in cell wall biosynthesis
MKILYLGNEDMRKEGAGKTHFFEVANNLKKLGHEITIMLPGYFPIEKEDTELNVIYIPTLKKSLLSYGIFEILKIFYVIWYVVVRRHRIIYSRSALFDFMPGVIALFARSKYFTERNGIAENEMRMSGMSEYKIKLVKIAEFINSKLSHGVICVTKGIAEYYTAEYNIPSNRVHVVSNGTNIDKFRILNQDYYREKISVKKDVFIVGFVGTFAKWQYLDLLVKAANVIKHNGVKDIQYLLVGSGSEQNNIKNQISKCDLEEEFILAGKIAHEEIPEYISTFDICYLCKHGLEGGFSPLKMYEYLACGKPVLANKIEGIEEFVEANNCGILFDSKNLDELVEKILDAYSNKNKLMLMGMNGRNAITLNHSWNDVAIKLENIIERK